MIILGLDISTKTGYAVLKDGVLSDYDLLRAEAVVLEGIEEDFSILDRARRMQEKISLLITKICPDKIVIEQTNAGRFRGAQKQLEFIHCLVLDSLINGWEFKTTYVDTSQWRSGLKIKLTKEQRTHNKQVKSKTARGKLTPKHLAVAWVNETYKLELKLKDNDIADAICLCHYGNIMRNKHTGTAFDLNNILNIKRDYNE